MGWITASCRSSTGPLQSPYFLCSYVLMYCFLTAPPRLTASSHNLTSRQYLYAAGPISTLPSPSPSLHLQQDTRHPANSPASPLLFSSHSSFVQYLPSHLLIIPVIMWCCCCLNDGVMLCSCYMLLTRIKSQCYVMCLLFLNAFPHINN